MLKRKGRHIDRELASLLQDKGLDPNFAVMLKENGLDPMILALLQRSSLDANREHSDSNPSVTDSNNVEDVLPNHISFSEELRLQGLGKWLQRCRVMLHHVAGTPERAWLLFSLIFILETIVVAIFRPKTIKLLNATHQQFEFSIAVLLLSPVVCSLLAFLRSLQAEDLSMTSKPRKCSTIKIEIHFSIILSEGSLTCCLLALDAQCFYYQFLGKIFYIVAVWLYRLDAEHLCWSAAFILKVKDFAAYLAVSSNTSGSTAKDLFTDVMDELEKQVKKSPYIEMMKNNFLFFQSSTNDENKTPSPPLKYKEVSSWRSVSLSSGSFYDSGSGKKNFMDLSKSPHGHMLIRTIRRLTNEKVQMASEVSSMLWNQVAERASAKEEASILQAELDSRTRRLETEKNELQSVVLEKELDRRSSNWKKLYSEEMDVKQLQDDLAATVRGNDILKWEVQNALDALSYATPKLKYLKLQVRKKDENINQLSNDLKKCMKELGVVKAILPKVFQERDLMWEEVKSYSEMNMLLNYEINMLKRKIDTLDEDFLMKEGQITILKNLIGKPFNLLASPDSLLE
ncbi:hypothetical protein BC332_34075 [Capsicum chinense]|nr:hypothetical protein BC332_34075 [Capsicum chinense]